jgi:hypothetical protein
MNFLLIFFIAFNSALASLQVAEFSFKETTIRLPKTKEGEVLRFSYEFTNSGASPLIITEIKVQCTCTQTEFPKEPVQPGEKGIIKVSFDTKNKIGFQDRTLEVYANVSKSPFSLRFKVMVDNKK